MAPVPHNGLARLARINLCAAFALAAMGGGHSVNGDARRPTEYQVKAAYLAHFAKFIEWPPGALTDENPLPVCIVGQDPFGPWLDAALSGESVDGHRLVARRISTIGDAEGCRILFTSDETDSAITSVERMPVLTVSDTPGFLKRGGIIEFVLESNRVRFEVNLAAAKAAGLTVSSELLRVATGVRRTP
jgi:hypothetical protein